MESELDYAAQLWNEISRNGFENLSYNKFKECFDNYADSKAGKTPERKPMFSGKLRSECVDKEASRYVLGSVQSAIIEATLPGKRRKIPKAPAPAPSVEEQRKYFEKFQLEKPERHGKVSSIKKIKKYCIVDEIAKYNKVHNTDF